jgi:hypothetical protein
MKKTISPLQPFEVFRAAYLPHLEKMKKRYLVTQTYRRAEDMYREDWKIPLLLTDYDDLALAKVHVNAVKKDKYLALVDLQLPAHRQRITELLDDTSRYRLYWAVIRNIREVETKVNAQYADGLRRYISAQTSWKIGRDTVLRPSLQVIFGELFLIVKYAGQTLRVKFEEIENS